MAPNPQCAALAAAKDRKGTLDLLVAPILPSSLTLSSCYTGLSYGQIASAIGQSEQHVIDSMFSHTMKRKLWF